MTSQQWIEKSDKYIMKTYGRYPIVPVRGEGCRLWDADGKEYLDFLGGVAVNNLGHCHPKVVAALQAQASELIHCSNYYQIPQQIELAELLCSHSFADKAFFCNSGAEANEAAIKLARKYSRDKYGPERYEIITAAESFHGRTMATVSATGQEKVQRTVFPMSPSTMPQPWKLLYHPIPAPSCWNRSRARGGSMCRPQVIFRKCAASATSMA